MAMDMLDYEQNEEDVMADLREEMEVAASKKQKQAEQKRLREGTLPRFSMPKDADLDGKRRATIRFYKPLNAGTKLVVHHRFKGDKVDTICMAQLIEGYACQYCQILMERAGVSRAELYKNPTNMSKYANPWTTQEYDKFIAFKTEYDYIWDVWSRETMVYGSDDEGAQVIFGWHRNNNTPINQIYDLNAEMLSTEDGHVPVQITEYDIKLVQTKDGMDKTFTAREKMPTPFDCMHRVKPLTRIDLKFLYAIGKTYDDNQRIEMLQSAWKTAKATAAKVEAAKKKVSVELPEDE